MSVALLLPNGFETIEALAPADLLRRAKIDVTLFSLEPNLNVVSAQGVNVKADRVASEVRGGAMSCFDAVVLPGGPGHEAYLLPNAVTFISELPPEKLICAICAAPTALARIGLLRGVKAACYPDMSNLLTEHGVAHMPNAGVVHDGRFITARAAGDSVDFALAIVSALKGEDEAHRVRQSIYA